MEAHVELVGRFTTSCRLHHVCKSLGERPHLVDTIKQQNDLNSANPLCERLSGPVGAFNCLLFGEFLGVFWKMWNSKSTSCCYRFLDVFRKEIKDGRAEVGTNFWQSSEATRGGDCCSLLV